MEADKTIHDTDVDLVVAEGPLAALPELMFLLEDIDKRAAAKVTSEFSGEYGWPYSQCGLSFGDWQYKHPEEAQDLLDAIMEWLNRSALPGYSFHFVVKDDETGLHYGYWPNGEGDMLSDVDAQENKT